MVATMPGKWDPEADEGAEDQHQQNERHATLDAVVFKRSASSLAAGCVGRFAGTV